MFYYEFIFRLKVLSERDGELEVKSLWQVEPGSDKWEWPPAGKEDITKVPKSDAVCVNPRRFIKGKTELKDIYVF